MIEFILAVFCFYLILLLINVKITQTSFMEDIMKKLLLPALLLTFSVASPLASAYTPEVPESYEWLTVDGIEGGQIYFDHERGKILDAKDGITKADIPSVINGTTVTDLANGLFRNSETLESVVIPGTIGEIPFDAFAHCYVLSTVVIEEGVEEIETSAFYRTPKLTSISLPTSLTDIGDTAFGEIGATELKIPEGVEEIGDMSFYGSSKLQTVHIPSTVEEIGDQAFWQCHKLSNVYYNGTPEMWSQIEIGSDSGELYGATLHQTGGGEFTPSLGENSDMGWITVDGIVGGKILFDKENGEILEAEKSITQAHIPSYIDGVEVKFLANSLFHEFDDLESVVVPGTVNKIPLFAFANCDELTSVKIEEGVDIIGVSAFYGAEDLEVLTLPSSVGTIEDTAFGLTGLESVTLPEGLYAIGKMAFYGSDDLETVRLPSSLITIESKVFWQCHDLEDIYYNDTSTEWSYINLDSNNKQLLSTTIHTTDGTVSPTKPDTAAGKPSDWADEEIENANKQGLVIIMTGVPQYTDNITREQFAESVVNLVELSTGKEIVPVENPFVDTENIDVVKAYTIGVINGMSETTFEPETTTNREQIAVMLYRAALYIAENGGATILTVSDDNISMYDDSDEVSDWAQEAVSALNANKIMQGTSDKNLSPKGTTTVEQSILLLARMYQA